jgi:hypothetical protein
MDAEALQAYLYYRFTTRYYQSLLQLQLPEGGAVADGEAVATDEMIQYFKDNPPVRMHLDEAVLVGVPPYPIMDVDDDVDARVAVDLAKIEALYNNHEHETVYTWDELRPRVIARLNRMYGLA